MELKSHKLIRSPLDENAQTPVLTIAPKTRMSNADGLGVVIGIERYQYVPPATYAYNDAEVVREYLAETLGFSKRRLKLATNSKATQAEFERLLGADGWLARNIVKGKSDVVIYFSGHGIPSLQTKEVGLLPFDVDPNYSNGFPIKSLYSNLSNMGARSVTVFLDTCYSGQSRERKLLVADSRGLMIVPKSAKVPKAISVLSASTGDQISGALKDKEHGLFTYYLLKGLGGEADKNNDKSITLDELTLYVAPKVKSQAANDDRVQTPQLVGPGKRVLVRH
jgi:hypothetical protein